MDLVVGRLVSKTTVTFWNGKAADLTDRQNRLLQMLVANYGEPVMIADILKSLDITIGNLRVTMCELRKLIAEAYSVQSKWRQSYTLLRLEPGSASVEGE